VCRKYREATTNIRCARKRGEGSYRRLVDNGDELLLFRLALPPAALVSDAAEVAVAFNAGHIRFLLHIQFLLGSQCSNAACAAAAMHRDPRSHDTVGAGTLHARAAWAVPII
jgi:hypothetical protein